MAAWDETAAATCKASLPIAKAHREKAQRGFTLVELAVALVVIIVLAAVGIPRRGPAVERARASTAVQYLSEVRYAQDRYKAEIGEFAASVGELEGLPERPVHFHIGRIRINEKDTAGGAWTLTLTRIAQTSPVGVYTVTFDKNGYNAEHSTLELLPQINPVEDGTLDLPR